MKNGEGGESLSGTGNLQDTWEDPGGSGRGRGRGRGRGGARGRRSKRSVGSIGSRLRTKSVEVGWKGRGRGGRGGRKGGRTKQQKTVKITNDGEIDSRDFLYEESPSVDFQEWNAEEIADLRNVSSSEYENDNNGGNEYDDDEYQNVFDDVADREYIGEYGLENKYEDEDEDEEGGVDVDGFFNDDSDENRDVDGGQIGNNPDDETELSSSGYSD